MRLQLFFCLLSALLFQSYFLSAQDHLIRHDLLAGKTKYYRIEKQTDSIHVNDIIIRRKGKLILDVENYNPYYWQAKVTAVRKPEGDETNNSGLFNPFSVLTQGLGGLVKSIIPELDLAALGGSRGGPEMADDQGVQGYMYWASEYLSVYKRLREKLVLAEELAILKIRLEELKYDITKPAAEIKKSAKDAVITVTGTDNLDFENILKTGRIYQNDFVNLTDSLDIILAKLDRLITKVDREFIFQGSSVGEMDEYIHRGDSIFKKNKADPNFLSVLGAVAMVYRDIQAASYHYTYIVNSTDNIEQLCLQLFSRKDSLSSDTLTRYFPVQSKGHLRLRNSVGIAFSYFGENNKRYFVRPDTTIGSSKGDYFTPVISTYIHFYGYKTNSFKLGGAIGFGVPITGEKRDINFMIGISGIIGKNEPILVSIGAAGAKVKSLADGWQTGNKVPDIDFTIPTDEVFRVGFFLSVSFNLGRMSLSNKVSE